MNLPSLNGRGIATLSGAVVLLGGGLLAAWMNVNSAAELSGRYTSGGQVLSSKGELTEVRHSIQFSKDHFHAMTRQGDTILETSGSVEFGFLGHYLLRVESGRISGLWPNNALDDDLLFNLLYARKPGSTLKLEPLHGCLYAQEVRQVYCAQ